MEKTFQRPIIVRHTVTSAEETATEVSFGIISGQLPTDDFEFIGQVKSSGTEVAGFDWEYSTTTGALTISEAGSAEFNSGDIITVVGTYFK